MSWLSLLLFVALSLVSITTASGGEDRQQQILNVFHLYRQETPQITGITPGLRIDSANAHVAASVLPPDLLKYVQAGDFTITVQATTNMPLREEYIKATLDHSGQVNLSSGLLTNYVAGLPFPLIDPQDPQAGEKAAWNHRYRDRGDTVQYWPTNELRDSKGGVERADRLYIASIYGMHRPREEQNLEQWENNGVYSKTYLRTLAPGLTH